MKMNSEKMKSKNKKVKGFGLPMVLLVFTAVFLFMLIPIFFTRIHFVGIVNIENKADNVQSALLTLLASTHEGKTVERIIGEHVALKNYPDIENILSQKLDKILNCYELKTGSEVLAKSSKTDCSPDKFTADATVPLPFGEEISVLVTLRVD